MKQKQSLTKKTWEEFYDSGLLWFINTILHMFGWTLVTDWEGDKLIGAYPARTTFRGFSETTNDKGYIKVSEFMEKYAHELASEARNDLCDEGEEEVAFIELPDGDSPYEEESL